jgi:hypothetical protein
VPNETDRVEKTFHAHYELGDLGIVPRKDEHIMTNFEKKQKLKPTKELNNLQKLTKKTVSTQTIDHVKVKYLEKLKTTHIYIYINVKIKKASLFGIEDEYTKRDKLHPIYSESQSATNQKNKAAGNSTNPQFLLPLNDQHRSYRVTNNVF